MTLLSSANALCCIHSYSRTQEACGLRVKTALGRTMGSTGSSVSHEASQKFNFLLEQRHQKCEVVFQVNQKM